MEFRTNLRAVFARKSAPVLILFILCILFLGASGCSTISGAKPESGGPAVQSGDNAEVRFTCMLKNDEVVASSLKDLPLGMTKSRVFVPVKQEGPVSISTGTHEPDRREKLFEVEIMERMGPRLVGMKQGESRRIELTAEDLPERSAENYTATVARVRVRPREVRLSAEAYSKNTGTTPEAGKPVNLDPDFDGRIERFTDKEVIVGLKPKNGNVIETPFGTGRVIEEENQYKIDIDAKKDAIVRSGPFVGRITAVDEKTMTLDYRNPFGGEPLLCDVTVEKITKEKPTESAKGE